MQGVVPTLHVSAPTGVTKITPTGPQTVTAPTQVGELERTMVQSRATPGIKPKSSGGGGNSPSLGGTNAATLPGDLPTQDLSSEQLLRDAPRLESGGQMCPSLNGIPLLYKLGQGGMGAVYYGVHPRLRSEVAVKVLPFHLAAQDPGMIQRFFREAQIAAKVRSPHLVSVIDVNEESGLFFLVMEYVSGVTMGQYLKKQIEEGRVGLGELDAIDSCIAACMGLDAAHQHGIIHRDLKPDNIMLPFKSRQQKTFDIRNAKLMDLGLARSEDGNQSLTGVQAAMGTPGYMAPEQALDAKTADKRSDVFGMGATIYALLAGRAPFKGDVVMKVLMATMHEPHPPITDFRPDISPGLVDIINRCLDKHPENRYADARQLIRALKAARKILHPDSSFGGEDEGGPEENLGAIRTATAAPRIGDVTRVITTQTGHVVAKSKLPLYGGIAAAVLVIGTLAVVFGRGKPEPEIEKKVVIPVENIPALPEGTKKLVLEAHAMALQGVAEAIARNDFEGADFKFNNGVNADQQFVKNLPDLTTDWGRVRKEIDSAKRAANFDNTVISINLALKSANIDEALKQSKTLQPETPSQIEESKHLIGEVSRAEKKIRNKDQFNKTLIEARNDSLKIDQKLALVATALELIPDEPHALELQKNYKAIQATEIMNEQFKLQMNKARNLFVQNNPEAALKAVTEAKQLKPDSSEAQDLSKQILAIAGEATKKEFAARSKRDALEAYKLSKDFFDKKDSAKALEQVNIALANVPDDNQYITHRKDVQALIAEEERVVEVARRKAAFKEYFKDASENLDYATDVKKAASLDIAMERINDAKLLKLDDPYLLGQGDPKTGAELAEMVGSMKSLESKIVERQNDLKTRKQFDDWLVESSRILDENEVDGKLANIETALKKVDDALKIAAAGKVTVAKDGTAAEELKKKLEAKKEEIGIRDQKREQVATLIKKGDDAILNAKYSDALQSFKSAELITRDLSIIEKNEVQDKIRLADTKIRNLKEIDGIVLAADKLIAGEKFDEAAAKLNGVEEKIMPDKRVAVKKAEIETKKAALDALVKQSFTHALDAFRSSKLNDAIQGLQTVAEAHPTRTDVASALKGLKEVQRIDADITTKLPDLRQRYGVAFKIYADIKQQKTRVTEAFEKLPKLTPELAETLSTSGMAGLPQALAAYVKHADDYLQQGTNNVIILEGMYREEQAKLHPAPPVTPVTPPKLKVNPEQTPDL